MTLKELINRMGDTERIMIDVDGQVTEACTIEEFFEENYRRIHSLYRRQVVNIHYSPLYRAIRIELG